MKQEEIQAGGGREGRGSQNHPKLLEPPEQFPQHCVCVCVCVLVTHSCPTLCDAMDCNPPGSSVHGILQQESWSGLPFSSPGNLPDPGVESPSPTLHTDSLLSEPPGKFSILNCDVSCMLRGHISYGHT